jgi:hypothetical protein
VTALRNRRGRDAGGGCGIQRQQLITGSNVAVLWGIRTTGYYYSVYSLALHAEGALRHASNSSREFNSVIITT